MSLSLTVTSPIKVNREFSAIKEVVDGTVTEVEEVMLFVKGDDGGWSVDEPILCECVDGDIERTSLSF